MLICTRLLPRPTDVCCTKRFHGFESRLLDNYVQEDDFHSWEIEGFIGCPFKVVLLILVVCSRELMRENFIILHYYD